jgi:hypothetical protein
MISKKITWFVIIFLLVAAVANVVMAGIDLSAANYGAMLLSNFWAVVDVIMAGVIYRTTRDQDTKSD